MAYTTQLGGYVKFIRGTKAAWNSISFKDKDTLYFIADAEDTQGKLYLGSKLIAGGDGSSISSIKDLADIFVSEGIIDGSLLVFNSEKDIWEDKPVADVLNDVVKTMVGASAEANGVSGLVPTPKIGDQTLFLRGDATWADPTANLTEVVNILLDEDKNSGLSIREIAQDEVAKIVAEAPEEFDTLKEIADWISKNSSTEDIVQLNNRVNNLEGLLNGTEEESHEATQEDVDAGLAENVGDKIIDKEAVEGLGSKIDGLTDSLEVVTTDISTLKDTVSDIKDMLRWSDLVEDDKTESD